MIQRKAPNPEPSTLAAVPVPAMLVHAAAAAAHPLPQAVADSGLQQLMTVNQSQSGGAQ